MSEIKKAKDIVRIAGERIDLCVIRTDEDAIDLYTKWMNDETINMYIGRNHTIAQWYANEQWAKKERQDHLCNFCIVDKFTRTLIGTCTSNLLEGSRNASLGICIGEPEWQNKGYGTEAIKMLIKFAFEEQNAHRVELFVNGDNIRAIKCYEKSGLKICGTMHDAAYYHGHYCDVHVMEILRENYSMETVKTVENDNNISTQETEELIELEELSKAELKSMR